MRWLSCPQTRLLRPSHEEKGPAVSPPDLPSSLGAHQCAKAHFVLATSLHLISLQLKSTSTPRPTVTGTLRCLATS